MGLEHDVDAPRDASRRWQTPRAAPWTAGERLPKWSDPRLHPGPSAVHGVGVFTSADIAAGETLMLWGGLVCLRGDYDPAIHEPRATTDLDDRHSITELRGSDPSVDWYLNHSCDPNVWMTDSITVVARRPIAAGREVLIDAAMFLDDDRTYTARCRCGAPGCRVHVHGRDWQRPELQDRYRGHFCKFLVERLAAAGR